MTDQSTCAGCAHFGPDATADPGECRAHPPDQPFAMRGGTVFDYRTVRACLPACGEFKARRPEPEVLETRVATEPEPRAEQSPKRSRR